MNETNEFGQIIGRHIKNWQPVSAPSKRAMQGAYCILEMLDINKHTSKLYESLLRDNKGDSWTYLPYGPFKNCDEFEAWLKKTNDQQDTLLYAVMNSETLSPIGIAGYLRINPEHGVIEVGHLHYSTLLKRTPAATEAMYLMMRYAFEELGYRRYEWKCNSLNEASRRAALRFGFKFEGIFRQCNVYKNRNRDTAWFSIIDSEWPDIKKRFQRWLSAENFDANGNQITSLNKV